MTALSGEMRLDQTGAQRIIIGLFLATLAAGAVLVARGLEWAVFPMLLLFALAVLQKWLLNWRALAIAVISAVLLVPANLYKLPSVMPVDVEIYRLVVFALLAVWTVSLLLNPETRLRRTPLDTTFAVLVVLIGISFLVNLFRLASDNEFVQAVKALFFVLTLIALFYALVSTMTNVNDVQKAIKSVIVLAALVSILAIFDRLTGYNLFRHLHEFIPILEPNTYGLNSTIMREGLRVAGSAAHPIAFGALLGLVLPLGLHYWISGENSRERWQFGAATGLIAAAMLLTVSRTAFVGMVVALVLLALSRPEKRALILSGLVVLGFVMHMMFPGLLGAITSGFSPAHIAKTEVGNTAGRLADYPRIWAEFVKYPLFGRGFGTFDADRYFFVDNQYLKFLVELGLAGTIAVVWFFARVTRWFYRAGRSREGPTGSLLVALAASALTFLVTTATYDSFGFAQGVYLFFILTSLGTAVLLNIGESEERAKGGESVAA